jgi:serpin B
MQRYGAWRTLSALAMIIAVAGCGTGTPTPTFSPTASTSRVPTPSPTPTPVADGSAWVPAGALLEGRASTHAVALADGRVLVVGSDNVCTPGAAWDGSVAAEVFDPAAGTWSATESLNAPRDGFVAVTLDDGRALVTGGITGDNPADGVYGSYSSTKLYDPQTGTWSATGLLNTARFEPAAALLHDGTVLVAGGTYIDGSTDSRLASAEIYDPESGEWTHTGDLSAARSGAQAVTLADGRVLVVGGDGDIEGSWPFASTEIYDPATGTWTAAGALALPRYDFSLVALPDGGAMIIGGFAGADSRDGPGWPATSTVERFDPRTGHWSDVGTMHTAAANRTVMVLGDGRVLVAGGIGGHEQPDHETGSPAISDAELYDPATGAWTATTPLPGPRERASAVTLTDGSVLLVGGDTGYTLSSEGVAVPWCPGAPTAAIRYVPANLASFPEPTPRPIPVDLAISDVPRAAASPTAAKKAATAVNAFGFDLYRRMLTDGTLKPTEGAVISPTSVALALAMARAGAKGETAAEMDAVLDTSGWDELGPGLNALTQALASRDAMWSDEQGRPHELKLRIANAAFAQRDMQIEQAYLDAIASAFGAGLRLLDYAADPEAARLLINAWVKRQTAGRIPELIPSGVIQRLTRLVLVNAIYLKANWEMEFGREYSGETTEPRPFRRLDGSSVTVPTMSLLGEQTVPYASGSGWKATELRYLGANGTTPLAMTLILPSNLASFERSLTAARLAEVTTKLDRQRRYLGRVTYSADHAEGDCGTYAYSLNLFMPRFGIDRNVSLAAPIEALGMPLAFDVERADFTGIATLPDGLYISDVIHQANIDVDEKGTEAAAATAVILSTGGCTGASPAKLVTLRLDRPFFFVLRDVETGAILFMGRVTDPSVR